MAPKSEKKPDAFADFKAAARLAFDWLTGDKSVAESAGELLDAATAPPERQIAEAPCPKVQQPGFRCPLRAGHEGACDVEECTVPDGKGAVAP